jgi:DUF4097 and DUF4098 domain-containing protein YvlB
MNNQRRVAKMALVVITVGATFAAAETRKEYRYTVKPRSSISITNQYGPISVKSAGGNQVSVTAILQSEKVEIYQRQNGNRVDIMSHLLPGADSDNGRVSYEISVPADASVTMHSSTGPLRAERLRDDVTLEGASANIDVRDVSNAHVHIKTLNGAVAVSNIRQGHVEITSVSGDITLNGVSGSFVQVNSTSGKIRYDGDFGNGGRYVLTSHTGDIEATAPVYASIEVMARSEKGAVENDFPLEPEHTSFMAKTGSAFAGTVGKAASSVKLFTFSGKIHLKKR